MKVLKSLQALCHGFAAASAFSTLRIAVLLCGMTALLSGCGAIRCVAGVGIIPICRLHGNF